MNRHLWLASGFVALALSGCVVRQQPVATVEPVPAPADYATTYPTVPPPAPIAEFRPQPPGYGYLWVDGYWDWTGYDWSWSSGYWVPERVGYVYVRPRYVFDGGHWVYHRSYWNGPEGRRDYDWGRPARGGGPGYAAAPVRGAPVRGEPEQGPGRWPAPAPPPAGHSWIDANRPGPAGAATAPGRPGGYMAPQPNGAPPPAGGSRGWWEPGAAGGGGSAPVVNQPHGEPSHGDGAHETMPRGEAPRGTPMSGAAPGGTQNGMPGGAGAPAAPNRPTQATRPWIEHPGETPPRMQSPGASTTPRMTYPVPQRPPTQNPSEASHPMSAPGMGARPAPTRSGPSNAVSGGRPSPTPVQGNAGGKRKPNAH